jgi:hypothetical protein
MLVKKYSGKREGVKYSNVVCKYWSLAVITDKNVNTTIATIYEINTLINFR